MRDWQKFLWVLGVIAFGLWLMAFAKYNSGLTTEQQAIFIILTQPQ